MNKADRAFLRYLNPSPADTVVDLWYGDADLARAVAAQVPTGQLVLLMPDATAKTMAEHDLSGVHNVTVMVAAGAESLPVARFDLVYLAVRPYLSNARLADLLSGARRCLRPGGRLLLFASMRQGAPTLLRRAEEVFGNMQILDSQEGHASRVAMRPRMPMPPSLAVRSGRRYSPSILAVTPSRSSAAPTCSQLASWTTGHAYSWSRST